MHQTFLAFPFHLRTTSQDTFWLCTWAHPTVLRKHKLSRPYASQWNRGSWERKGIEDAIKTQFLTHIWRKDPYPKPDNCPAVLEKPKRRERKLVAFTIQPLRHICPISPAVLVLSPQSQRRSSCRPPREGVEPSVSPTRTAGSILQFRTLPDLL